jgi:hypothetical protein
MGNELIQHFGACWKGFGRVLLGAVPEMCLI